jgi:hypothetical protein
MGNDLNRRQFIVGAGAGAVGAAVAVGSAPAIAFAEDGEERLEGSYYGIVHVETPSVGDFDVTYGFAAGGMFTRLDGRNNAPSLGTWTRGKDGEIIIVLRVFHFTGGVRDATIYPRFDYRLEDGVLSGTWIAIAHPLPGFGPNIPGFPSSGTFRGTRIVDAG